MENQDLVSVLLGQASIGDPIRYANLIRATRSEEIKATRQMLPLLKEQLERFEKTAKQANEFRKQVSGDGYARRRKDAKKIFEGLDQQADLMRSGPLDISIILATHFDHVVNIYTSLVQGAEMLSNARMVTFDESHKAWEGALNEKQGELGAERVEALFGKAKEVASDALQNLSMEQRINQGASVSFSQGLMMLERVPKLYADYLAIQARNFEAYYEKLRHRHSNGTIVCDCAGFKSATLTDVSILVWDNVDKVGEIESGHGKDELSAYTLHRANAMVEAAKSDDVWPWLVDPGPQLLSWVEVTLPVIKSIQEFVIKMKNILGESTWRLLSMDPAKSAKEFVDVIDSLDLTQITQRPPERAFSKTERFALEHRNKAIQRVSELLSMGEGLPTIVSEILQLKVEERNFYINENSFYVCKIGTGNVFSGEAPGALEVIPGEKPNADLNNIWGSGFDEIRDFISGMDEAKKWNDLFLSTSPSGSTDKNNVLLVGPQGCGKTQVMRAIGSTNDSIAIFAVGSSFLTCWLGEAQKNPARLFDEAVKLHKASNRPVHILIDEIDSVLNNDQNSTSRVNLSTEFQNLMDGVVAYPGISIWGATNHPQKIPTPMLRRFAKVMVVGELSQDDTIAILRHYIENYLPCSEGFTDEQYRLWAKRLEGATGDAIRKAVDEVWLTLMRGFIKNHKEAAEKILEFIKNEHGENFDVASLTSEDREKIKAMIAETGTLVSPEMVTEHIEKLLNNFAIQQQIITAKETYRNAKKLLERQKAGNKGLGFEG